MMTRTRRLRKSVNIRKLVRENHLSVDDLIYPLFIEEGENIEKEIISMPGIKRYSLDKISLELAEVVSLNIPAVLLFGIPSALVGAILKNRWTALIVGALVGLTVAAIMVFTLGTG